MQKEEDKVVKFLRNIVDIAWNECTESSEVPATSWADEIIYKANVDNLKLSMFCEYRKVDNGLMGFHDYEYETSCGKSLDCSKTTIHNYCPHCGGKIKSL